MTACIKKAYIKEDLSSPSPQSLALLVTSAWERGELGLLRDLVELGRSRIACLPSTHDKEVAEMVEASIRTIACWVNQPLREADMDVQVALGVLKHLAQDRPSASLVM